MFPSPETTNSNHSGQAGKVAQFQIGIDNRQEETLGKTRQRKKDAIETKESFRWLKGVRLANEVAEACPNTHVISVADREADIYDIFLEATEPEFKADFVIRAKQNRRLPEEDPETGPTAYHTVVEEVASGQPKP